MAFGRQRKNGSWEFKISIKGVLLKPEYHTFDTKEEGESWCSRREAELRQGIAKPRDDERKTFETIKDVIRGYMSKAVMTVDDEKLLGVIENRVGLVNIALVNYIWIETWIEGMKRHRNMSSSTIRHHVGALRRCFDWASRRGISGLVINPIRMLPKNYSTYSEHDKRVAVANGGKVKDNAHRERRLESGEEDSIRTVLAQSTRQYAAAAECLFSLALESAMRLREMYTIEMSQLDFPQATIFLEKTKNGDSRQVPMTTVAAALLSKYINDNGITEGLLFPWWSGKSDYRTLHATTDTISKHFAGVFAAAGCPDFHFHDIRHEATSRLFEKSDLRSEVIQKITGHKTARMLAVYTNLRGADLAKKLW